MGISRGLATLAAALLLGAAALAGDSIGELEPLVAEGTKWFKESGNTDLAPGPRNAARVKSWKSL